MIRAYCTESTKSILIHSWITTAQRWWFRFNVSFFSISAFVERFRVPEYCLILIDILFVYISYLRTIAYYDWHLFNKTNQEYRINWYILCNVSAIFSIKVRQGTGSPVFLVLNIGIYFNTLRARTVRYVWLFVE